MNTDISDLRVWLSRACLIPNVVNTVHQRYRRRLLEDYRRLDDVPPRNLYVIPKWIDHVIVGYLNADDCRSDWDDLQDSFDEALDALRRSLIVRNDELIDLYRELSRLSLTNCRERYGLVEPHMIPPDWDLSDDMQQP